MRFIRCLSTIGHSTSENSPRIRTRREMPTKKPRGCKMAPRLQRLLVAPQLGLNDDTPIEQIGDDQERPSNGRSQPKANPQHCELATGIFNVCHRCYPFSRSNLLYIVHQERLQCWGKQHSQKCGKQAHAHDYGGNMKYAVPKL